MVRLPKGKCALYWENLLLAVLGDQFMAASQYICGVVVSIRNSLINVNLKIEEKLVSVT